MATLKFYIRTQAKNKKLISINCRLRAGRSIDMYAPTGLMVIPNHWSNKTQTVKNIVEATNKDEVNSKLRKIKDHVLNEFAKETGEIQKDWLADTIDRFNNPEQYEEKKHTLFSYIRKFIDKADTRINPKTNRPVCYKMVREYERTFYYLQQFAKAKKGNLDFKDIDLDFYHDFIKFLQSEQTVTRGGKTIKQPGLAQNTIGKKIQTLKIFLNAAMDDGISENRNHKSHRFTAISEESDSVYLTETELQRIFELDLTDRPHLDRTRDLFLVGCWTGLRFSDWNKVTPENIEDGFITIKQAKTGGKVVIPLHPTTEAVIAKYGGNLPKVMTNQEFNRYLKEVAKDAGIVERVTKTITKGGITTTTAHEKWEMVTTHTARRSFATNLYKAGFPTLSIMQITGHKTEQAFLKYIKVTPDDHARKLKEFWQNRPVMKKVVNI